MTRRAKNHRRELAALFGRAVSLVLVPTGCSTESAVGQADASIDVAADTGRDTTPDVLPAREAETKAPFAWPAGCAPVHVAGDDCNDYYRLPCGLPDSYAPGPFDPEDCLNLCPVTDAAAGMVCFAGSSPAGPPADDGGATDGRAEVAAEAASDSASTVDAGDAGTLILSCAHCTSGRRPAGFVSEHTAPNVGAMLAQVAELEAASIDAFADLRHALRSHGAPRSILRAISRARRDETRHARTFAALARRHGAKVRRGRAKLHGCRTLATIARENAVEGCVRETFGAAIAKLQAARATDPAVAAMYRRIAHEETRHAGLARAIDEWLRPRLDAGARADVERARYEAATELRAEIAREGASVPSLGLPTAQERLRLFDALRFQAGR